MPVPAPAVRTGAVGSTVVGGAAATVPPASSRTAAIAFSPSVIVSLVVPGDCRCAGPGGNRGWHGAAA